MTPEEKRNLKRRGKQIAEERSAALHKALRRANPAPIGSYEWMQNYRTAKDNEKWFRDHQPKHLLASEVSARFVLLSAEETGHPEPFIECLNCHDVLHSYPTYSTQCSCGAVAITYSRPPKIKARDDRARAVRLIPRGRPEGAETNQPRATPWVNGRQK